MGLHNKYNDLVVVAISLDDGPSEAVRAWAEERGANFPVLHDPGGRVIGPAYDIQFYPTHLLIDREGNIVARSTNQRPLGIAELEQEVSALLQ